MEPAALLAAALEGFSAMGERYAQLVEGVEDTSVTIPASEWTVRDAAVHLAGSNHRMAVLAGGAASTVPTVEKRFLDARARRLIAENPETDGKKLADQIREGLERVTAVTVTLPGDQPISFHGGIQLNLAELVALYVGEYLLHGYDIAVAVGAPWRIDPAHAALALHGYRPCYSAIFNPANGEGIDATFELDTTGNDPLFVRIAGATYEELETAESVDCVISTDAAIELLVISGRLTQWSAIALGRLTFSGHRLELGPRFADLFVFP